MSSLDFQVDSWLQGIDPDPRRAGTFAEVAILIDGVMVTRLLDTWSKSERDRARLPLYPLAEWFASNWWRLHAEAPYEGGSRPPVDWRMSHDLAAIGGGFVWPRLRFASDSSTMQVSARGIRNAQWEPVRYLVDLQPPKSIALDSFDRAVERLVAMVLDRLASLRVSAEPLATIWSDVVAERLDPEITEWRMWEARLGCDPDDASERLMQQLVGLFGNAGKSATAEVAPLLTAGSAVSVEQLERLSVAPGIEARMARGVPVTLEHELTPWDAGRKAAHATRGQVGHPAGPLATLTLANLLGVVENAIEQPVAPDLPIGLGVLAEDRTSAVLHFRKRNPVGRRFEAARFLADALIAAQDDRWLPITDRATARQKFQRAYAAELLAPIDEIVAEIGDETTPDRFDDVADRYGVSPLAIRSQMANHGLLPPDQILSG